VQRGRGGRLKFSNKRSKDEDDEMDVDEDDVKAVKKKIAGNPREAFRRGRGRGGFQGSSGRGIANGRRGLGEEKRHGQSGSGSGSRGGRVMKSPRGKNGRR